MAERRTVAIASGHAVTVRRVGRPASRPGYVLVQKTHRPPFEIKQRLWEEGKGA